MTRLATVRILLFAPMAFAGLAGCAAPSSSTRASAAARSACQTHADDMFEQQNRNAVYRSDSYATGLRDSPFGSSGVPGVTTTGLSQQFGIDNNIQNCLNGVGDSAATTSTIPPGSPLGARQVISGAPAPATVK